MDPKVKTAIAAIPENAWTANRYPRAIWDDQLRAWVSDAEVAEAQYTAFTSKKGQAVTARLIVRRVRDLNKQAAAGQDELFPLWRRRAVFADSPLSSCRPRASTGTTRSWSRSSPTSPTGRSRTCRPARSANAAWLACAAIACNLLRAAGALASLACARARGATLRRDLINVAARTARSGRGHITLHLPEGWPRERQWLTLFAACRPPAAVAWPSRNPVTAPLRPSAATRPRPPSRKYWTTHRTGRAAEKPHALFAAKIT